MTAEKDRHAQLDPAPTIATARRGRARQRARAEERARREVLDLTLAVDRWIGHDRDRLVQVVREVRAPQTHALAGPERIRIADVSLERDESALAREDVLVRRLDVP